LKNLLYFLLLRNCSQISLEFKQSNLRASLMLGLFRFLILFPFFYATTSYFRSK